MSSANTEAPAIHPHDDPATAWGESDDDDDECIVVAPPGPRCRVCGHVPCPCCVEWCDVLLEDLDLCCDGQCQYEPGAIEKWQAELPDLFRSGCTVISAEGPFESPHVETNGETLR